MQLPTYTSTFKIRRKLYAIYDWELPWPLEVPQVIAFVAGLVIVVVTLRVAHLHLGASTPVLIVGAPVALAWLAPRAVADGKAAHLWLGTQLVHLAEPRLLHGLRAGKGPEELRVVVRAWEHRRPGSVLAHSAEPAVGPRPANKAGSRRT